MGKFIVISFLALGVGFYELSGGSDFVPEQRVDVAKADIRSTAPTYIAINDVEVSRSNAASLIALNPAVTTVSLETPVAVEEPVAEEIDLTQIAASEPLDIRAVSGTRVNMRQGPGTDFGVLDTLDGGTQAEVLEINADGWARIEVMNTGQIGWMAARLLTDG